MKSKLSAVLTLLLCLVLLCGCGMTREKSEAAMTSEECIPEPYEMAEAAALDADSFSGVAAGPAMEENSARGASVQKTETNPEKIIYSGDATLETTAFEKTVAGLEQMLKDCGGFVESSSVSASEYSRLSSGNPALRKAYYTLRIPSEKFQDVMNTLPQFGNVPNCNTYVQNISAQYYDAQARLDNYKQQEQRLNELLKKAETVSDIIEIEDKLTEVRYNIESLQTQINSWDRSVSYSTLDLTVREVKEYTPVEEQGFGAKLAEAFRSGIEGFEEFFLIFVEALPVLLFVLALIALAVWAIGSIISRLRRKSRERAAKEQQKNIEQALSTGEESSEKPEKE